MKKALIAVVVAFGFVTPALASHCPKDAKKIEAALASNSNAEAQALLEQGKAMHSSGKHKESIDALHQAMQILGLEH